MELCLHNAAPFRTNAFYNIFVWPFHSLHVSKNDEEINQWWNKSFILPCLLFQCSPKYHLKNWQCWHSTYYVNNILWQWHKKHTSKSSCGLSSVSADPSQYCFWRSNIRSLWNIDMKMEVEKNIFGGIHSQQIENKMCEFVGKELVCCTR